MSGKWMLLGLAAIAANIALVSAESPMYREGGLGEVAGEPVDDNPFTRRRKAAQKDAPARGREPAAEPRAPAPPRDPINRTPGASPRRQSIDPNWRGCDTTADSGKRQGQGPELRLPPGPRPGGGAGGASCGAQVCAAGQQCCSGVPYREPTCAQACRRSDLRLKREVSRIPHALRSLGALNGVTWYWKDARMGEGKQMGVIAQEVEMEFPELVHQDAQGVKSVDYTSLIGALVEASKELDLANRQLRSKVSSLERRLGALESRGGR